MGRGWGVGGSGPVIRWGLWMPQGGWPHVIEPPCEVWCSHRKGIANCIYMCTAHQMVAEMYFWVWWKWLLEFKPWILLFPALCMVSVYFWSSWLQLHASTLPVAHLQLVYHRSPFSQCSASSRHLSISGGPSKMCCWVAHFMLPWLLCVAMQGDCGRSFRRPDGLVCALWAMDWHHKHCALPRPPRLITLLKVRRC